MRICMFKWWVLDWVSSFSNLLYIFKLKYNNIVSPIPFPSTHHFHILISLLTLKFITFFHNHWNIYWYIIYLLVYTHNLLSAYNVAYTYCLKADHLALGNWGHLSGEDYFSHSPHSLLFHSSLFRVEAHRFLLSGLACVLVSSLFWACCANHIDETSGV